MVPIKKPLPIFIFCLILLANCRQREDANSLDLWKNEIRSVEASFAKMAGEEGLKKAFLYFAAPDAVLMRGNKIINGLIEIEEFFSGQDSSGRTSLTWSPDFVDVATSGDLGYTYGQYTYRGIDAEGQIFESKGIFHTVWKRQPDGNWRFVWD